MFCIKSTSLFALAVACALTLGAVPQPAAAQTATNLNCGGCVKSKQLKNGGVKSKDIKNGQVKNDDLGDNSVTGGKIADDAVTSNKVLDESLTGADVTDLTGSDINPDSVPAEDTSNEAGVEFATDGGATIAALDTTVISGILTAPSAGFVTVVASGTFDYTGDDVNARCSIVSGSSSSTITTDSTMADISLDTQLLPFTVVKTFSQAAGTTTYRLNCEILGAGSADIIDMDIAIMFFPTQY